METLSKMIDAVISQDKDGFVDSFSQEFLNRVNEKVYDIHRTVSKNLLGPEGVIVEPELEENTEETDSEINETLLRHAIPVITFKSIEEAKNARKQMVKNGMCESCITQRSEKLHFDIEAIDENVWPNVYFTVKEISENIHYDPYHEFAYFIKEALEDGEVEFELADGSIARITSEMAQQITRVHDVLSGKNQEIFRDNATLSEESFEQMMNFVKNAIENLDEELVSKEPDNINYDHWSRKDNQARVRANRVNAARKAGTQPSWGDMAYSSDPEHREKANKAIPGGKK
jgi:hypothetical protein